jgi:hypothetical protein
MHETVDVPTVVELVGVVIPVVVFFVVLSVGLTVELTVAVEVELIAVVVSFVTITSPLILVSSFLNTLSVNWLLT